MRLTQRPLLRSIAGGMGIVKRHNCTTLFLIAALKKWNSVALQKEYLAYLLRFARTGSGLSRRHHLLQVGGNPGKLSH